MKIQAARAEELSATTQTQTNDHSRGARSEPTAPASEPVVDRLNVSDDARFADQAIRAAADAPEIRQDVVERARQKLLSGELGRDVEGLADRMIDSLLG
jgi:flagellar biosynthesis anti-sigma factor FlgM